VKAISLWQPWASLWLSPRKVHETRHWPTTHRGWLVVHAAKRLERNCGLDDILNAEFGDDWSQTLPTGALIGVVDLVSCLKMNRTAPESEDDYECGDWSDERFAWRRGAYRMLPQPVPYRGAQALFDVPDKLVSDTEAA
jgi:hypothetical protein